jgi:hypothetical protein
MSLKVERKEKQATPQPTQHEAAKVNAYQPQPTPADDDEDIPF